MSIIRSLKLMLIPTMLVSCAIESPELVPCMCDGSDQTLGILDCMCEPASKKTQRKVAYIQDEAPQEVKPSGDEMNAYAYLHQSRDKYAPVKLEFVDFRIPKGRKYEDYDTKLGNYRFRIFGCRRFDKEVYLNQGRAMQKDMKFFDVFYETMNDYYPVVVDKSNPYYIYSDKAQPEYILTAEINDYFMNVCDEFDWNNVKKQNLRTGTSEMTVTWRLMDLSKSKVYCKGTTTGYGEMKDGEYKGETLLVERAFGDALSKLPEVECYNTELAKRVSPEEIQAQLTQVAAIEKQKVNFRNQYDREIQGIAMLQNCGSGMVDGAAANRVEATLVTENSGSNVQTAQVDDSGDIFASGREVKGYIDEDGNFVIDARAVDDKGGAEGRSVYEKGGTDGKSVYEKGSTDGKSVYEKGGVDGNGSQLSGSMANTEILSGYIDENGNFVADGSKVDDTGGTMVSGYIDENGNYASKQEIIERSGGSSKFSGGQEKGLKPLMLSDNCQEVELGDSCTTIKVTKNNITWADDYWLDIPADVYTPLEVKQNRATVENMFANANNNFCIQSVKPYENMSAENVYKLRSSVVAVENPQGRKGAGLIISDQLILTSADLLDKAQNRFTIKTINGMDFGASAFRVNPNKNVALLILDGKTKFAPLPLSLTLPEVGKDLYMTLGVLDPNEGENYLDNEGQVIGYRYTEEKGAEIIVNTYVQTQTLGSTLIDKNGNITGLSHSGVRAAEGGDLFIPIETALKSLGMEICGVKFTNKRPAAIQTIEKPVAEAIDRDTGAKGPQAMNAKERK